MAKFHRWIFNEIFCFGIEIWLEIGLKFSLGKGTETGGPKGWKFHHRMALEILVPWDTEKNKFFGCLRGLGTNIKKSEIVRFGKKVSVTLRLTLRNKKMLTGNLTRKKRDVKLVFLNGLKSFFKIISIDQNDQNVMGKWPWRVPTLFGGNKHKKKSKIAWKLAK